MRFEVQWVAGLGYILRSAPHGPGAILARRFARWRVDTMAAISGLAMSQSARYNPPLRWGVSSVGRAADS